MQTSLSPRQISQGGRAVEIIGEDFRKEKEMQHPFEGLMTPEHESIETRPSRRSMLGRMVAAGAALLGFTAAASAQTRRRVTTMALGEEGGRATTFALGEEGGRRVTTFALGEEGGRVTTFALGEEGGLPPPRLPRPTTFALGEEGGRVAPPEDDAGLPPLPPIPPVPPVPTLAFAEEGSVTTYALGEEGGGY
jgi:hypothetical protein